MSIYLLPLSLLAVRPPNRGATRLRSLSTLSALPFLVPCLCWRRGACRTVALDRKVPSAYLPQCPWLPITLCPASSSYAKRGKSSAWVGKGCPGADAFLERLSGVVETYISSRAGARAHTAFFVFCLHPSPTCVRRSKSNRCGEGKGEGLCSPLSSPLCESRLDCCGFWDKGRHVFDQSPLLFPHFRAVFPVRVE